MFSPKWSAAIPWLRNILPRYSTRGTIDALKWVFDRKKQDGEPSPSTIPLRDWPKRSGSNVNLLVMAFDNDRERATFFRSNPKSQAKSPAPRVEATLLQAVHASTNAPIPFFDEPAEFSDHRYRGGAMGGYNNPVLAAVIEAFVNCPEHVDDIRVLSIGAGTSMQPAANEAPPPLGKVADDTGLFRTVKKAATAILRDPPDAATFHAYVALRQPLPTTETVVSESNVVRLYPLVRPIWNSAIREWRLPNGLCSAEFEDLIVMPLDVMKLAAFGLIQKICDLWFTDEICNQPIPMGDPHAMRNRAREILRGSRTRKHLAAQEEKLLGS